MRYYVSEVKLERQIDIMQYVSEGLTSKGIGSKMFLSPHTIENTIAKMKFEHDALTLSHLVSIFFRKNLII